MNRAVEKMVEAALKCTGIENIVGDEKSVDLFSEDFDKRLKKIVDNYNSRDKLVFVSEVVGDFVDKLSDKLIQLLRDLEDDKKSFERLGVTYFKKYAEAV